MCKRVCLYVLAVVLGVLLTSFAVPVMAQAEQCSPDGKICLVNDTSQPLVPPTRLEFRVASEARYFQVTDPSQAFRRDGAGFVLNGFGLVEQGPPGGMSLWAGELAPTDQDYTFGIEAVASGPTTLDQISRATFSLPTLGSVSNLWTRVVQRGKKYVGEVHYEGRTTITSRVGFTLGLNPDVAGYALKRMFKLITRPGEIGHEQVVRVTFSRADVKRRCEPYRYCKLGIGVTQSYIYLDEQGQKRYMPITPDHYNGQAGLVVQDRRKTCQKLLKKNKQAYRKRCAKEPPPKKVPDQESPGREHT